MSEYGSGKVPGGMAPGEGQTTIVELDNDLSPKDKAILCGAICQCKNEPDIGVRGQSLKQQCVRRKLTERDKAMDGRSVYKPEINYNMDDSPPSPIMSSSNALEPHGYLPGWIEKYWPGGRKGYEPGVGNIRRPDVVVVKDPLQPPTQDNLKSVVEMKFPPDPPDAAQLRDYRRIAGRNATVTVLDPATCGCDRKPSAEEAPATSPISDTLDSLERQMKMLLTQRPTPGMPGWGLPMPPTPVVP
jgi:hypothetical protein